MCLNRQNSLVGGYSALYPDSQLDWKVTKME